MQVKRPLLTATVIGVVACLAAAPSFDSDTTLAVPAAAPAIAPPTPGRWAIGYSVARRRPAI